MLGVVMLVGDTCGAVEDAVHTWQQAMMHATKVSHEDGSKKKDIKAQPDTGGSFPYTPTTLQRREYTNTLQSYALRSLPLVQSGSYYFKNELKAAPQGDATSRLRRMTQEIATLAGQLPIQWESSIFVVVDEDRMDALRAVIFGPSSSDSQQQNPYSNGAFVFDILLPPDYPNRPPKVQFLTTGGGRVRFNPNLYNNGKVCLSLLGTWQGPSWDPKASSLHQVFLSIQAMILGESNPYCNEPGFENYRGRKESKQYNIGQRYNTLRWAVLENLRKKVWGFEELLKLQYKLKAEEVKAQARAWSREEMDAEKDLEESARGKTGDKNKKGSASYQYSAAGGNGRDGGVSVRDTAGGLGTMKQLAAAVVQMVNMLGDE